ncbi:MAG: cyclodeaminase/cyclohydrolase family protein [Planctomycetes bacterium]|nr:cyclodeaminase/cyclohydrolase family protein [Planctomycetota bacterium]
MSDFSAMSIGDFIKQAASDAPVPGGGGIAALVGALGGCMASMAANFTVGKPKYAEHDELMKHILANLASHIETLAKAVDGDAEAFLSISQAYKLPRESEADKAARKTAINQALTHSMRVPLTVARECAAAAELLPELAGAGNPNLLSDVEVAAIILTAAARAAEVNVLANTGQLDSDEARQAETEAEKCVARAAAKEKETLEKVQSRRTA